VIDKEDNGSLWLRHLASESSVQIVAPQPVDYWALSFSPDGSHIYYSHTRPASAAESSLYHLYRTPALGGTPQLVVKDVHTNISFSPDGQRFVFLRANDPDPGKYHLIIANADGSNEKSISSGPMDKPLIDSSWSPDGKTIAAALFDRTENSMSSVISIDSNTGNQEVVSRPPYTMVTSVSWLPDGKALAVTFANTESNSNLQQVGLIGYPDGKFRPITADTNDYASGGTGFAAGRLSVSADGGTIATVMRQSVRDVYVSSGEKTDYSDARQITSGDPVPEVSWTRDGNLLTQQGSAIRVISPAGGLKGEIAAEKDSAAFNPYGCSDGHVVLARGTLKTFSVSIWRSEADGSGLLRLTEGKNDLSPMCSPDGKTVFYTKFPLGAYMKVSVDGGTPERVSQELAEGSGYDIARDGKTILLGTYDFKAQKPTLTLVSLPSGQSLRTFQYDLRHTGP
jgi:Tol biopolymer transport system component